MRPAGKTACLFFLFLVILIFPIHAESAEAEGLDPAAIAEAEAEALDSAEIENQEQMSDVPADVVAAGSPINGFSFFEELFFEEFFNFDPSFLDEENLLSEETSSDEENPLSGEEDLIAGDASSDEDSLGDETLLAEDALSNEEENLLSEEILPGDETLLAQVTPPIERAPFEEEDLLDDDSFFFEAPPLIFEVPTFEVRSFDTVFPNLSPSQKAMVKSENGMRNSFVKDESPLLVPNPDLGINLLGSVLQRKPSHLIEALVLVPYKERELDLLDIYNALGRIENIKDHPVTLNGQDFYVFTESSRIESNKKRKDISDPSPAATLPFSDTMYLRLKEVNYGNLFIRGDVSISLYGITYSMTNFTDVRYFLIPIMKAERFISTLYLEPVKEGMLIYSMTGFYLPGFIADKVNLTPNINRRIKIFVNWITEGLRKQEIAAQ